MKNMMGLKAERERNPRITRETRFARRGRNLNILAQRRWGAEGPTNLHEWQKYLRKILVWISGKNIRRKVAKAQRADGRVNGEGVDVRGRSFKCQVLCFRGRPAERSDIGGLLVPKT